jgi:hypothetical protein
MRIEFFDDPLKGPHSREDVRFNQLGLYVYDDRRRIAVGFDITPFLERPSVEVTITNAAGEVAANLTVIEAMQPNFNLTMHLRDKNPADPYQIEAILFYQATDGERKLVDSMTKTFKTAPSDQQ